MGMQSTAGTAPVSYTHLDVYKRQIVQSGQSAVRQEKRALLGALKPFVTDEVAGQFDHALRLVSMARMARAAMGQLGQLGRTDDGTSPDSNTPQAL